MGLVIYGAVALYLLISLGVVLLAVNFARKRDKSAMRWGCGAVLVMYLIPFLDWLPTVITHQYYCVTESGFWVYKTPDQWKAENPGVMETLRTQEVWRNQYDGDMTNYVATYVVNQRIDYITKKNGPYIFRSWLHEQDVRDSKTGEVLARRIDFSTGNGNVGGELEIRFWLHRDNCGDGRNNAIDFVKFVNQLTGEKK